MCKNTWSVILLLQKTLQLLLPSLWVRLIIYQSTVVTSVEVWLPFLPFHANNRACLILQHRWIVISELQHTFTATRPDALSSKAAMFRCCDMNMSAKWNIFNNCSLFAVLRPCWFRSCASTSFPPSRYSRIYAFYIRFIPVCTIKKWSSFYTLLKCIGLGTSFK